MGDETLLERILNGHEEPKDLPLALLQSITNDFSQERKIGQGGFGVVYKGELQNGIIVAVKRIEVNQITIDDVSFRREFNSLMNTNHQNVVRFLGFCSNTHHIPRKEAGEINLVSVRERLLCFEYIRNGSLDKHITGYSCMYAMAPYLVYPAEAGGQRPFYDGIYPAGAYGQGGFLPPWMTV